MFMFVRVRKFLTATLILLSALSLHGQRVLYSPFIDDHFEVSGKVGDYYWIQKKETVKIDKRHPNPVDTVDVKSFEIYDTRMNPITETRPYVMSDQLLKEYLVCNNDYFDQLIIQSGKKKTNLLINRYRSDGSAVREAANLVSFPFIESANSFLLARSEDKTKILLLCFESSPGSSLRLHALLFDENWRQITYRIYERLFISQPLIQDDFTNYPIESYNNSPLKVANDGQWMMMMPSRSNSNYSLFHFFVKDSGFVYREIKSPIYSVSEDVALSIDNEKQEVIAGVLSSFRYPTLKNVEVVHYSMNNHQFDFDSSYRFNTLVAYKIQDENLIHESFMAVPGAGFMLLKEYGKAYISPYDDADYNSSRVLKFFFASNYITSSLKPLSLNRNGYTRYDKVCGTRKIYERGDLSMFYFPASRTDSCWSGIINKEQITEFNVPWLSYLLVPMKSKLFLLYNSFFKNEIRYGNSTVLDLKGNLINDEGLVYWKF
ncbi:MAG: hypothetical protein ACHQET_09060, partial [Chitinophagales bacterium]